MPYKKSSIKDVAALAGLSTATVSNVFSGRKPVNDAARQRVLEAAESLDYRRNRAASHLRSGQNRVVAVLVPDLTDSFFAMIVSCIEAIGHDQGYDIIVASSRDDPAIEASRLNAMLAWRPAGVIAIPCSDVIPEALTPDRRDVPVVFVDRVIPAEATADTVTLDNRDGGEIAARHLIERGHRDIVLAASRMSISAIRERARGASDLIVGAIGRAPMIVELTPSPERGTEIFGCWLERHSLPSAVLALTNVTALSALSALARQRIAIPERTSVLAFDDYPWMSAGNTGLSAIAQPTEEMARAAWQRLLLRMQGHTSTASQSMVFHARLVVRDSVRDLAAEKPADHGAGRLIQPSDHRSQDPSEKFVDKKRRH